MQLAMFSVWLLGCCYAVANGFYVIKHIAMWLLGCCYAVDNVFCAVARVLLCSC